MVSKSMSVIFSAPMLSRASETNEKRVRLQDRWHTHLGLRVVFNVRGCLHMCDANHPKNPDQLKAEKTFKSCSRNRVVDFAPRKRIGRCHCCHRYLVVVIRLLIFQQISRHVFRLFEVWIRVPYGLFRVGFREVIEIPKSQRGGIVF